MNLWVHNVAREAGHTALIALVSVAIVAVAAFGLRIAEQYLAPQEVFGAELDTTQRPLDHIRSGSVGNFGAPTGPTQTKGPEASFVVPSGAPILEDFSNYIANAPTEAALTSAQIASTQQMVYSDAPYIKVGLFQWTVDKKVTVTAPLDYGFYSNSKLLKTVPANKWSGIWVDAQGKYHASYGTWSTTSDKPIIVRVKNGVRLVTLPNYENRPGWNPALNDNTFRGQISVERATNGEIWVVNKLRLNNYVKGVAEASNSNADNYLKAMGIAERTYALYLLETGTKYPGKPFTLTSTSNDQVYKGYNFELRSPNVAAADDATNGLVVTYQGKTVVTPYFSRSDGRTRSWSEVWSGDRPWLVSVTDPGCAGQSMLGHGVGMSASGARWYSDQGWTWKQILTHYYTGIEITRYWNAS